IGMLLAAISNMGLDSNTYVIFSSDNGAARGMSTNAPLSRGKTFVYEGGVRVPFIIKGPNIAANSRSEEAIVLYDLYRTFANLSGSNQALPDLLDGKDLSPLFFGTNTNPSEPIYFHSPHYESIAAKTPRSTLVEGNYKLMADYETGNFFLFDLDTDISERTDLSAMLAADEFALRVKLRDYLREVEARMPGLDPTHANFSGTGNDVDNDGLPDEWEFVNMLTYTYGPNDDPDNDGILNLDEYNNGTDPYSFTTSIPDALIAEVKVYPNPGQEYIQLEVGELEPDFLSYQLYDLEGRVLREGDQLYESISTADIARGRYYLRLEFRQGVLSYAVVLN
ncbi:MAG: sulfatase/phosphatase domain-containing protein, partial [Bacteroidota bacterium]